MSARHKNEPTPKVPTVTSYTLTKKAAPAPAAVTAARQFKAAPTGPDPAAEAPDPVEALSEEATVHEWAGDLYEEGDETDPAGSFSSFTGPEGEEAWLDRADDGTLTGWVRDSDGSVYRYSDADAWAIDVDQAGMDQQHLATEGQQAIADQAAEELGEEGGEDGREAVPEDGADLEDTGGDTDPFPAEGDFPEDAAGGGDPFGAPTDEPIDEAPTEELPAEETPVEGLDEDPAGGDPIDEDPAADPLDGDEGAAEEDEEDEDEGLPPFLEGKSWPNPYGVGRLTYRPL